ncbi:tail fiber assembly protein [Pseudomonas asplenii]|uniref:tail fiber assembly protein n=1 Tax=Pseudomonas asplenii TaxID=53407 RepID=UPI0009C06B29|nr:tail fiber assembly protein [Pseudomonas fuscovaginae]
MSYALKIDRSSYRAVAGPEKRSEEFPAGLTEDEVYCDEVPTIISPPPTAAGVLSERDARLGIASLRIAPLQDAVDLGDATESEKSELKLWKQYRVSVNRVTEQEGFPSAVEWPEAPGGEK